MNKWNMWKPKILKSLVPIPLSAGHIELSALASADDEPSRPTDRLLDICLGAIQEARQVSLEDVTARLAVPPYYTEIWPGEHYKLLAGFVKYLKPACVVEIGTFRGLGTLALAKYMRPETKIVTFDVVPWDGISSTVLTEADFSDQFIQFTDDLADIDVMQRHEELLKSANLIFIDAAKDGVMEQRFLDNLDKIGLGENTVVIFDDIRLWNMLGIWRSITLPKLDLTSFGHWSGTGVVQWIGS